MSLRLHPAQSERLGSAAQARTSSACRRTDAYGFQVVSLCLDPAQPERLFSTAQARTSSTHRRTGAYGFGVVSLRLDPAQLERLVSTARDLRNDQGGAGRKRVGSVRDADGG